MEQRARGCEKTCPGVWQRDSLLSTLALAVLGPLIASAILGLIGYGIYLYRSRLKVSLTTHGERSRSDFGIRISITNHGKIPVIVDSWKVHTPWELPPELAKKFGKPEPSPPIRFRSIRRLAWRCIGRLLHKWNHTAQANALRRALADSMLGEIHLRYPILGPGTTQRVDPGESIVGAFPRVSNSPSLLANASDTPFTIVPSCHIVGHRRCVWGLPSTVTVRDDGSIGILFKLT